jgi:hypothetical protein
MVCIALANSNQAKPTVQRQQGGEFVGLLSKSTFLAYFGHCKYRA